MNKELLLIFTLIVINYSIVIVTDGMKMTHPSRCYTLRDIREDAALPEDSPELAEHDERVLIRCLRLDAEDMPPATISDDLKQYAEAIRDYIFSYRGDDPELDTIWNALRYVIHQHMDRIDVLDPIVTKKFTDENLDAQSIKEKNRKSCQELKQTYLQSVHSDTVNWISLIRISDVDLHDVIVKVDKTNLATLHTYFVLCKISGYIKKGAE